MLISRSALEVKPPTMNAITKLQAWPHIVLAVGASRLVAIAVCLSVYLSIICLGMYPVYVLKF